MFKGYLALVLSVVLMFPLVGLTGYRTYQSAVVFEQGCGGHLMLAANANTIELAKEQLSIAINFLNANQMTEGYTSLIYNTPDEDVGFWYKNLKASLKELKEVSPEATQLEKSNVLMKLRETLIDHAGNKGDEVTTPSGISIFPNNKMICWGFISKRAFSRATYPSRAMYSSMFSGLMTPQLRRTMRNCFW